MTGAERTVMHGHDVRSIATSVLIVIINNATDAVLAVYGPYLVGNGAIFFVVPLDAPAKPQRILPFAIAHAPAPGRKQRICVTPFMS